jgi:CheY-like chemotaxis protein
VSQILTFARKTEVLFRPIDVNVMIQGIVNMLRETFPKTIDFALHLVTDIPLITADATQVHQVLLNIAVNARDAMPIGGVLTFTTEVVKGSGLRNVFTDIGDGYYVHVYVSDTGIGMDDTTRSHIFDPFFTTKEKGKGTGLGLSVVYGVMKNHNGFIDVQSEPGKGSTFNLYFPIREESPPIGIRKIEKNKEIQGGNETILFVEDEESLLLMMKILLEGKGYRVLTASDGLTALDVFRQHKDEIALVVTDVGLPKIGGDQLFFELKKVSASVRVILASGYIDPGTKAEILEAGAGSFVQKPYVPDTILKKIRDMIDGK